MTKTPKQNLCMRFWCNGVKSEGQATPLDNVLAFTALVGHSQTPTQERPRCLGCRGHIQIVVRDIIKS